MTLKSKRVLPATPIDMPSPPRKPVWGGPVEEGISQTMISRYLSDGERFRILYVEGLQPIQTFNPRMEFGNIWHEAEEKHAADVDWERAVYDYGNKLGEKFPTQVSQIVHWLKITVALFPEYVRYWKRHPDVDKRKPLLQEEKFCIPYKLPSGRVVKLRGKWDSVDYVTLGANRGIWLQENKTKSSIDRGKIERQLRFDLQTMLYLIALQESVGNIPGLCSVPRPTIRGVRYNVIRRSAHKTDDGMMKKLTEDMGSGRDAEWFARWNVEVLPSELDRFKTWALDPILENICDDYEWWSYCHDPASVDSPCDKFDWPKRTTIFPGHTRRHFVMPYIGYNPLAEGGESDVDYYLFNGTEVGLERITNCFPEL